MGGLFRRLDHQHPVLGCIEAVKGGRRLVELVSQHQDKVAARRCWHTDNSKL
jgi:hypothetical protein